MTKGMCYITSSTRVSSLTAFNSHGRVVSLAWFKMSIIYVCVCVCERERECVCESVSVCVCVCV